MNLQTSRTGRVALRLLFGILVVFLWTPLALLVVFSFDNSTILAFPLSGFTTRWYSQLAHNGALTAALRASAQVAAISSAIAITLGTAAAFAVARRRFHGKAVVSGFVLLPLVMPYVVFGISLLVLFRRVGVPLSLGTVVIGHVVLSLPFTVLVLAPRIARLDKSLEEAARDLGAGWARTFRSVTLPLILPAIVAAFLIAFTLSFDEFAVASFVVGEQATFPVYLYSQLRFPSLLPQVVAAAVVVMTASLLVILIAEVGRRVFERRLGLEASRVPRDEHELEAGRLAQLGI